MAIDLYKGFTNKIAGETFVCTSAEEAAFCFDWIVQPEGYVPFNHIHLNQDEVFYIKEGELRMVIDGKESIVRKGECITVPKGSRHIACNNKPSVLHCAVEYRPGLDIDKIFQCFGGLTIDGDVSKNGTINIPKMLYFSKKMKAQSITRPSRIPAAIFTLASGFFFIAGTLLGWNRLLVKYTGKG